MRAGKVTIQYESQKTKSDRVNITQLGKDLASVELLELPPDLVAIQVVVGAVSIRIAHLEPNVNLLRSVHVMNLSENSSPNESWSLPLGITERLETFLDFVWVKKSPVKNDCPAFRVEWIDRKAPGACGHTIFIYEDHILRDDKLRELLRKESDSGVNLFAELEGDHVRLAKTMHFEKGDVQKRDLKQLDLPYWERPTAHDPDADMKELGIALCLRVLRNRKFLGGIPEIKIDVKKLLELDVNPLLIGNPTFEAGALSRDDFWKQVVIWNTAKVGLQDLLTEDGYLKCVEFRKHFDPKNELPGNLLYGDDVVKAQQENPGIVLRRDDPKKGTELHPILAIIYARNMRVPKEVLDQVKEHARTFVAKKVTLQDFLTEDGYINCEKVRKHFPSEIYFSRLTDEVMNAEKRFPGINFVRECPSGSELHPLVADEYLRRLRVPSEILREAREHRTRWILQYQEDMIYGLPNTVTLQDLLTEDGYLDITKFRTHFPGQCGYSPFFTDEVIEAEGKYPNVKMVRIMDSTTDIHPYMAVAYLQNVKVPESILKEAKERRAAWEAKNPPPTLQECLTEDGYLDIAKFMKTFFPRIPLDHWPLLPTEAIAKAKKEYPVFKFVRPGPVAGELHPYVVESHLVRMKLPKEILREAKELRVKWENSKRATLQDLVKDDAGEKNHMTLQDFLTEDGFLSCSKVRKYFPYEKDRLPSDSIARGQKWYPDIAMVRQVSGELELHPYVAAEFLKHVGVPERLWNDAMSQSRNFIREHRCEELRKEIKELEAKIAHVESLATSKNCVGILERMRKEYETKKEILYLLDYQ